MSELISVIIPVYNIEDYVEKCVNSVISQTYTNVEIILVDDGSTDQSGEICDRIAQTDKRITVFHKKNGGLSDARNYGLEHADGEWVGFVDGDDYIHPQMYEILYWMAERYHTDAAACQFERDPKPEDENRVYNNFNDLSVHTFSAEEAIEDPFRVLVTAWNKIYKREVFSTIRFPVGRLHEDEFVFHELMWKSGRISVVDKGLYYYIVRDSSIMETMSDKRIEDALAALSQRIRFAEEKKLGVLDSVVDRYCMYCADTYCSIKCGDTENEHVEWLKMLYDAECDMVSKQYHIQKKYLEFAKDPDIYAKKYKKRRKTWRQYLIDWRNMLYGRTK